MSFPEPEHLKFWEREEFHYPDPEERVRDADTDASEEMQQPELKRRREEFDPTEKELEELPIHPLLIDHVIEKILHFVSRDEGHCNLTQTVKQFRLVCKLWCYVATNNFRKQKGRISFENDFNRKTAEFIKTMRKSDNPLFNKFKLSGGFVVYKPYKGHYEYDKIYDELFKICSPSMQFMEFTSHNPSDLKFPKDLRSINLLGLKTISFHVNVYYESLQMEMPSYFEALLNEAKQLERLELRISPADPSQVNDAQIDLMLKFGDIIATRVPKSCKHLKLNMMMNENQMKLFEAQFLRLESLVVDFQKGDLEHGNLEGLINSQANTLKFLELIEVPCRNVKLPVMSSLSHLRIEGRPILPEFKFKKSFPALKDLEIVFYWIYQDENWLKDIFIDNGISESVLNVNFLCEINDSDSSVFYRIARSFPKMKCLSIHVNSLEALSTIFTTMTCIEELEMSLAREFWHLPSQGEVDSAFCGIPAEHCVILLKESNFATETQVPATLCKPSLRNLTELKRLKIRAFRADNIPLTDVTVHFALMKMKNLKELTLDVFPISKEAIQVLEKRVHLTLLPGPPTLP